MNVQDDFKFSLPTVLHVYGAVWYSVYGALWCSAYVTLWYSAYGVLRYSAYGAGWYLLLLLYSMVFLIHYNVLILALHF